MRLLRRPRSARSAGLVAVLLGLAFTGCGCGGAEDSGSAGPESTIEIGGSSTVFRISDAAREAYVKVEPKVNVVVGSNGTGPGFSQYLKDELDIVDASRPAKPEEELKAKTQGIEWTRFLVGYDGIAVVVNAKNTFAKSLNADDLKRMFEPGSKVKTWKDVDPSWPDKPVVFYTPDKNSGTFDFFTEAINGKQGAQRDDAQLSTDDNILVRGVAGDEFAIGYFGFAYYAANKTSLRAIAVKGKGEGPAIEPNQETILSKAYTPLSRPLYIYVKNAALRRPAVAKFVAFYLDRIEEHATNGGYVPPTADDRAQNKKALPGATAEKPSA